MASAAPTGSARPYESKRPLSEEELRKMHAYWRAANYLSVGQIYLYANPLLHEPLKIEHLKPRLLGHWGTTPGLNFIYVHFNRLIKKHDLNVISVPGPGHGGPGLVANTYLEGTYSEFYSNVSQAEEGLKKLFKRPLSCRVGPPHDRRSGALLFHRLHVRFGPSARYLRASTPSTAVHRRWPRPQAARSSAPTFVRSLPVSRGSWARRQTRLQQPSLHSESSRSSWVAAHGTTIV
jgi:hypothetical protein